MPNPNPNRENLKPWTQLGSEPLSRKVWGVKLPQSASDRLEQMVPEGDRPDWLRRVITEALSKEFPEP
jgi:hypothetical protein